MDGVRVYLVSCTVRGYELARWIEREFVGVCEKICTDEERETNNNTECKILYNVEHIVKCSALDDISIKCTLSEKIGQIFDSADLIVFFTAAGIAVRSIAPYILHKSMDPAVVVVDECGTYAISLLSGHMGGANEYTRKIADILGAEPVITTATDREGRFAVDEFARKNNMVVTDWKLAKQISAYILEGGKVEAVCGDYEHLSEEQRKAKYIILISNKSNTTNAVCSEAAINNKHVEALCLVPKNIYIGIGCRKGTECNKIEEAMEKALSEAGIRDEAVTAIASIDLKAGEQGLLEACSHRRLKLIVFTAEELVQINGSISSSEFVESVTGVDNVCERSAIAAGGDRLVFSKHIYDGVTVAIAEKTPDVNNIYKQLKEYDVVSGREGK
jgi:cobalt-precorrin 5A hydrolase